jgi:hypothetical protein
MNLIENRLAQEVPPLLDHSLIESAYLSELWAVQDIGEKLKLFPSRALEKQLAEERFHVELLGNCLAAEGHLPRQETRWSMQEVIYRKVCLIDLGATAASEVLFRGVHEITERRAIWIYRTYLLGGTVERYKKALRRILHDERGHIHRDYPANDVLRHVRRMDQWVFRIHLFRHYNRMNLLQCPRFWADYYGRGLHPA